MRHLKLDLTEDAAMEFIDPMRPLITVWTEGLESDGERAAISVSIGSAWGAAQRYLTLKPKEARTLAKLLVMAAEQAETEGAEEIVEGA